MASSIFQKLIRNHSATRIVSTVVKPQSCIVTQPLLTHLSEQKTTLDCMDHLIPVRTEDSITNSSAHSLLFYPSFSFAHFLNPSSRNVIAETQLDDVVSIDSGMIWADSVKKKRKRKMNKHKLRKLRRRLRKNG